MSGVVALVVVRLSREGLPTVTASMAAVPRVGEWVWVDGRRWKATGVYHDVDPSGILPASVTVVLGWAS